MKNYTITVNGVAYDVVVEENGAAPAVAPVVAKKAAPVAAPKAAPAPAAPKAAAGTGRCCSYFGSYEDGNPGSCSGRWYCCIYRCCSR